MLLRTRETSGGWEGPIVWEGLIFWLVLLGKGVWGKHIYRQVSLRLPRASAPTSEHPIILTLGVLFHLMPHQECNEPPRLWSWACRIDCQAQGFCVWRLSW